MNLELRTEVWHKGHHPWESRIMRNEYTGQRAKEYYRLRTKPRKKDEKENAGVRSEVRRGGRGGGVHGIMKAKERNCQEREKSKM